MSKYGVISGPYFPAFGLNTERYFLFIPNEEKYGPEITPYLDTFHAVEEKENRLNNLLNARSKTLDNHVPRKRKYTRGNSV